MEHLQDSSHNVKPKHHESLPYGAQSHILQVVATTESQVEAPFSWERSMACVREGGRISFKVEAAFECCSRSDLWTSALAGS